MKTTPSHDYAVGGMIELRLAMHYVNCNHDYRLREMMKEDAVNQ